MRRGRRSTRAARELLAARDRRSRRSARASTATSASTAATTRTTALARARRASLRPQGAADPRRAACPRRSRRRARSAPRRWWRSRACRAAAARPATPRCCARWRTISGSASTRWTATSPRPGTGRGRSALRRIRCAATGPRGGRAWEGGSHRRDDPHGACMAHRRRHGGAAGGTCVAPCSSDRAGRHATPSLTLPRKGGGSLRPARTRRPSSTHSRAASRPRSTPPARARSPRCSTRSTAASCRPGRPARRRAGGPTAADGAQLLLRRYPRRADAGGLGARAAVGRCCCARALLPGRGRMAAGRWRSRPGARRTCAPAATTSRRRWR